MDRSRIIKPQKSTPPLRQPPHFPELQKSVGVIVFRIQQGRREYLLLGRGKKGWSFPKGRQEAGERDQLTAARELAEETALTTVHYVPGFVDEYRYRFRVPEKRGQIHKVVICYLAQAVDNAVVRISDEHTNFGWFEYGQARKRAFFPENQELLDRAERFLSSR